EHPDRSSEAAEQGADAHADDEDGGCDRLSSGPRSWGFEACVDAGEGAEGGIDGEVEAVDSEQHEEWDSDSQGDAERGNMVAFARWDAEELLQVAQTGSAS